MEQVEALVLPQSLFPSADTLMSIVNNFESKPPVVYQYGPSAAAQVGWVDSVSLKPDGLYAVMSLPAEGAEKVRKDQVIIRGELSLIAIRSVIDRAMLVKVNLLPK